VRSPSISVGIGILVLSGCGPRTEGQGDYVIRGSLVDGETGAPVSRENVYVHVFNDAIQRTTSPEREDASTFTVRMPLSQVRLRVVDTTDRYHLYETTLEVPARGLDHVVQLVPTHYVLLKGRVLIRDGTAWVPHPEVGTGMGETPLLSFGFDDDRPPGWTVALGKDAAFEVRLPRERLRLFVVDSPLAPETPVVDLTGVTDDVVQRDIHFVP
jgi:hypothetical protein